MRSIAFLVVIGFMITACDDSRVYEQNYDFSERYWLMAEKPSFDFTIQDTTLHYNLFCNIRNSVAYPYSRIFIRYSLQDSSKNELKNEMITSFLFDEKTGKPFGSSGLGDIYDQQPELLRDFKFNTPGTYSITFEQFMRTDTLQGVLAVGVRVETSAEKK
jgi:gliding motility-associated lipoprotein GldH